MAKQGRGAACGQADAGLGFAGMVHEQEAHAAAGERAQGEQGGQHALGVVFADHERGQRVDDGQVQAVRLPQGEDLFHERLPLLRRGDAEERLGTDADIAAEIVAAEAIVPDLL